jgi:hypothetical protein
MMDLKIHSDFSKVNLDEMKEIYSSVGWTKHTKEIIKQVFEASNVFLFVTVNVKLLDLEELLRMEFCVRYNPDY